MNILEKIKQLEEQLTALRKEVENKPAERNDWPNLRDTYYTLDFEGDSDAYTYVDDDTDKYLKQIGNMFKTEEEAEAYKQYLMKPSTSARAKLQMWADENNKDFDEAYYYFYHNSAGLYIDDYSYEFFEGVVSFSSYDLAEKAIQELGEELIKTALGVYD